MSHKNTINWNGEASENAAVIGDVESSPSKYIIFIIQKDDKGTKVATKMAGAWNAIHGGLFGRNARSQQNQVTLPVNNVNTTVRLVSLSTSINLQEVPIGESNSIKVAGLDVFHPT